MCPPKTKETAPSTGYPSTDRNLKENNRSSKLSGGPKPKTYRHPEVEQEPSRAHYSEAQGVDIDHRDSAIQRSSITEDATVGAAGGCGSHTKWQPEGGNLAVTEPQDETEEDEEG